MHVAVLSSPGGITVAGTDGARVLLRARRIEPSVALLVAGIALACYLQGAFYPRAQLLVAVPMVVAALLAPRWLALNRQDLPVVLVAAALACWAMVDGVLTGHLTGGSHYLLLIAGVLGVAGVCRGLPGPARLSVVHGLIAVCCAVAVLGWLGVVAFRATWGFRGDGMWRASSTLTYPNATAVALAMAALVCLALRGKAQTSRWLGCAATILVVGMAATLSRAGLGGLVVGLCLLCVGIGWRPLWLGALGPLLGALVAMAGLLPSTLAHTPTVFTVALATVAAAIGLAIGGYVRANRVVLVFFVAGLAAAPVGAAGFLAARFTLDSPDRWGSFQAAWMLFLRHPLTGLGPGIDQFVLGRATGSVSVYRFVHNEYLQILAELGVLGGILVVALVILVIRRLWRDRQDTDALGIGGLAAVVALSLDAGFDFVWHIPAIPLLGAAFVGVAIRHPDSENVEQKESEQFA
jgi:hypothetical protein